MPGSTNSAADAASRKPSAASHASVHELSFADAEEVAIVAGINRDVENTLALSWSLLAQETKQDDVLQTLLRAIQDDFKGTYPGIEPFARYRDSLHIQDGFIMYEDRVVVPSSLRPTVLQNLHSAHQGASAMELCAQSIVFWPGMSYDVKNVRSGCSECNKNAPSQAPLPPEHSDPPTTPFEQIFSDFFEFGGHHYLIVGDRLSGWSEVYATPSGSQYSGARGLIRCLRTFFVTFGVPDELSSDGGPEFVADSTRKFLEQWDVRHRISSAYFPQSNGRAEVAVKSAKRLLRSNVGPNGSLSNDKFLRAMLQLRNTPDPDCHLSPAEIVFGRRLKDSFSFANTLKKLKGSTVRPDWMTTWGQKELALRKRFTRWHEDLKKPSRMLQPLKVGDKCFIQNQYGPHPKRWDRSGTIVEESPHHQYLVKIDGSGRVSRRNRRFLRRFEPASNDIVGHVAIDDTFVSTRPLEMTCSPSQQVETSTCDMQPVLDDDAHGVRHSPAGRKLPLMLRRLQPHNKPGRTEISLPEDPASLHA